MPNVVPPPKALSLRVKDPASFLDRFNAFVAPCLLMSLANFSCASNADLCRKACWLALNIDLPTAFFFFALTSVDIFLSIFSLALFPACLAACFVPLFLITRSEASAIAFFIKALPATLLPTAPPLANPPVNKPTQLVGSAATAKM